MRLRRLEEAEQASARARLDERPMELAIGRDRVGRVWRLQGRGRAHRGVVRPKLGSERRSFRLREAGSPLRRKGLDLADDTEHLGGILPRRCHDGQPRLTAVAGRLEISLPGEQIERGAQRCAAHFEPLGELRLDEPGARTELPLDDQVTQPFVGLGHELAPRWHDGSFHRLPGCLRSRSVIVDELPWIGRRMASCRAPLRAATMNCI